MLRVGLPFLLFFLFWYQSYGDESAPYVEKDSMYWVWEAHRTKLPNVYHTLDDFNDVHNRSGLVDIIDKYGIGGVLFSHGNHQDIRNWVAQVSARVDVPPVFVVKTNLFELPFEDLILPSKIQVECVRDLSMVTRLAETHVSILKAMGIQVLHINEIPLHYEESEMTKVRTYFNEIQEGGIHLSFGKACAVFVHQYQHVIDWDMVEGVEYQMLSHQLWAGRKAVKKFRQMTGYQGLITSEFKTESLTAHKYNQWNHSMDVLWMSDLTQSEEYLQKIREHKVLDEKYFKHHIERYYARRRLLHSGLTQVGLPDTSEITRLNYEFLKGAITLLKDENNSFPVRDLASKQFYTFTNDRSENTLAGMMALYVDHQRMKLPQLLLPMDSLRDEISKGSFLIIDLSDVYDREDLDIYVRKIVALSDNYRVGVLYRGVFDNLPILSSLPGLLWSPDRGHLSTSLMTQMMFGAMSIRGQLPDYLDTIHQGIERESIGRLRYEDPIIIGVDELDLSRIDQLVKEEIRQKTFPGCQIVMVQEGAVVYHRSFGHLTYDSIHQVTKDHLYDIASVTKTTATVPALIHLVSNRQVSLDGDLSDYIPIYEDTHFSSLKLSEMLSHQSGLRSYIPFWTHAEYSSEESKYFHKKKVSKYKYNLAEVNWVDSVRYWVGKSSYNSLKNMDGSYGYLYSDLGFMLMKEVIEETSGVSLDAYVDSLIYAPMSMDRTLFNPLRRFSENQIAPTEQDDDFREQLIQGRVHDKNADLLGGVSGHAGLFSNANDMAKYMQMMLQDGYYGGDQILDSLVVKNFIRKKSHQDSRAMGWDKPRRSAHNVPLYASDASFGHTGFTGASVWADPEDELIFIFLSNRVYPDSKNDQLIRNNTRTRIHNFMYKSILSDHNVGNQDM